MPVYRSPPNPSELLDIGLSMEQLSISIPYWQEYSVTHTYSVNGGILRAIACRYLKQHPEMFQVDHDVYCKMYASYMFLQLSNYVRCRNRSCALEGSVVDGVQQPDDMLDFEYMLCTMTFDTDELLRAVQYNSEELQAFIHKRCKDKRYKYMKNKRLRDWKYWLNPSNWIGFSAGFIADFYFSVCLGRGVRRAMWKTPIMLTVLANRQPETAIPTGVSLNPNFRRVFNHPDLLLRVATYFKISRDFSRGVQPSSPSYQPNWAHGIEIQPLSTYLEYELTKLIEDPSTALEQIARGQHVEPEAIQRQQGTILQAGQGIQISSGTIITPGDEIPVTIAAQPTVITSAVPSNWVLGNLDTHNMDQGRPIADPRDNEVAAAPRGAIAYDPRTGNVIPTHEFLQRADEGTGTAIAPGTGIQVGPQTPEQARAILDQIVEAARALNFLTRSESPNN